MKVKTTLRVGSLLAVFATAMALTACDPRPGGDDPTVHPPAGGSTPSVSSTPAPNPLAPRSIEVSALSVSVGANNASQLIDIPFTTDIATAAAELSATIGVEPTVTPVAATPCAPATSTYDWGGIEFYTDYLANGSSLGAAYYVSVTAPATRGGLEVDSQGQVVGESLTDLLANVPGSVSGDRGEGYIEALIQPQGDGSWGVILHIQDGLVSDFIAPGYFLLGHGTC